MALGNEFFSEFGKHGSAMLSFWLICLMAFNVFHAFFQRNLKPQVRRNCSMLHVARLISSRLYAEIPTRRTRLTAPVTREPGQIQLSPVRGMGNPSHQRALTRLPRRKTRRQHVATARFIGCEPATR